MFNLKNKNFRIIVAIVCAIVIITLIWTCIEIAILNKEKKEAELENERLKALQRSLESELEYVGTMEYVEREARSTLRLIKPEELLFIFKEANGTN